MINLPMAILQRKVTLLPAAISYQCGAMVSFLTGLILHTGHHSFCEFMCATAPYPEASTLQHSSLCSSSYILPIPSSMFSEHKGEGQYRCFIYSRACAVTYSWHFEQFWISAASLTKAKSSTNPQKCTWIFRRQLDQILMWFHFFVISSLSIWN